MFAAFAGVAASDMVLYSRRRSDRRPRRPLRCSADGVRYWLFGRLMVACESRGRAHFHEENRAQMSSEKPSGELEWIFLTSQCPALKHPFQFVTRFFILVSGGYFVSIWRRRSHRPTERCYKFHGPDYAPLVLSPFFHSVFHVQMASCLFQSVFCRRLINFIAHTVGRLGICSTGPFRGAL